jgi:hypothetical protein
MISERGAIAEIIHHETCFVDTFLRLIQAGMP